MLFCATILAAAGLAAAEGVAVKPASFYEVKFRARVVKGLTLEEFPQLEDLVPITASRFNNTGARFSGFNWQFRETEGGKAVPLPYLSATPTLLYHREWRDFVLRLWTPENATWFGLLPGRGVEVADVSIREAAPGDTLNVNPRFDMSDEYIPGWHLSNAAQFVKDRNGVNFVSAEEGSAVSDLFPVTPGENVLVTLRGDPQRIGSRRGGLSASICFFGAFAESSGSKPFAGRAAMSVSVGKEGVSSRVYTVPAGKRWARLTARGAAVYECAATKVNN